MRVSPKASGILSLLHALAIVIFLGSIFQSRAVAARIHDKDHVYYPRRIVERNTIPTAAQIAQYLKTFLRRDHSVFYSGGADEAVYEYNWAGRKYEFFPSVFEAVEEHFDIVYEKLSEDVADQLYVNVNRGFAMAASGKVFVFLPESPLHTSTAWTIYEWPLLQVNPAVTEIVAITTIGSVCSEETVFVHGQAPRPWPIAPGQAPSSPRKRAWSAKTAKGAKRPSNMCRMRIAGKKSHRKSKLKATFRNPPRQKSHPGRQMRKFKATSQNLPRQRSRPSREAPRLPAV